jgi:hypothetical protein
VRFAVALMLPLCGVVLSQTQKISLASLRKPSVFPKTVQIACGDVGKCNAAGVGNLANVNLVTAS